MVSSLALSAVLMPSASFATAPLAIDPDPAGIQPATAGYPDIDKELAGLGKDSKPAVLTWDRVYLLALLRARGGRIVPSPTLDMEALAREGARLGVADFAKFRNDFVASKQFHDPSALVLDLLRRVVTIDNVRRTVVAHETLNAMLIERIQGESSGLTRLDLDGVFAALIRSRQRLSERTREFRDRLDELKVALGLSPRTAIVLDRRSIAGSGAVFDQVESWSRFPNRALDELPRIIGRLPNLGEVVVSGAPILAALMSDQDQWEPVLTQAAQFALEHQGKLGQGEVAGDAADALELSIRRRIRRLVAIRRGYDGTRQGIEDGAIRSYELAIRRRDQAFERLVAPSAEAVSSRSALIEGVLKYLHDTELAQDRVVGHWTSFCAERLAFYKELGVLPYNDWNTFYADLSASPSAADVRPPVRPDPVPAPPPAPPADATAPPLAPPPGPRS
jgi:hypothetical protein